MGRELNLKFSLKQFGRNQQTDEIELVSETDYTYDSAGKVTSEIVMLQSQPGAPDMENSTKTEYEYNSSNQLVRTKQYSWAEYSDSWQYNTLLTNTYKDDLIKVVTSQNPYYNYPVWRDYYFYNDEKITNVPGIKNPLIAIFPNPASNILTIPNPNNQYQRVSFYSESGVLCKQQLLLNETNTILVNQLTPGIYIVKLEGKGIETAEKVVIE